MAFDADTAITSLTSGALYGLVGLGYTIGYRVLRTVNFAHAGAFMIGTFGALLTTQWFDIKTGGSGLSSVGYALGVAVLCALVAVVVSIAFSLLVERVAFRPLRRRRADRLSGLIAGLSSLIVIQEVVQEWRGPGIEAFPRLFHKGDLVTIGSLDIRSDQLIIIGVSLMTFLAVDIVVQRTQFGRAIRATAENRKVAALMGINVDRTIAISFGIAGITAGIAAVLFLVDFENTYFNIGFDIGLKGFTAAVLGGVGNIRGALLGGLVLGMLEGYGASSVGAEWADVIVFSVLVVVLIVRPTGLLRGEGATEGVRM